MEAALMSGTRRKPGPLGPYVEGYRARLLGLGYTPASVRSQLKTMGQLGRWLALEGLEVSRLDEVRLEAFLAGRPVRGRPAPGKRSFRHLFEYLRDERVIAKADVPPPTELDELVSRYRDWLVHERDLASATVRRYVILAHRFLHERCSSEPGLGVEGVTGMDVTAFLRAECSRMSVGSAKARVAELRSLLRFLYLEGLTPMFLADSVPPVVGWHDTGLPSSLSAVDVEAILTSCDRSCPVGARDFAILTVLARLGLRSAEVARLELGDVDWRAGEIVVHGKGRRMDRLPMPCEVGEAIVDYLVMGGPRMAEDDCSLTVTRP